MKFWASSAVVLTVILGGMTGLPALSQPQSSRSKIVPGQIKRGNLDHVKCLKSRMKDPQSNLINVQIQRGNLEDVQCLQQMVKALIDKGESEAESAIPFADLALEMFEKDFPNNHREISISRRHRAFLYEIQGEDEKAEILYWKALDIFDVVGFKITRQVTPKSGKADNANELLYEPPGFKLRLEKHDFERVLPFPAKLSKEVLPDGSSLTESRTRLVGLPKEDEEGTVSSVLSQLARLYYRKGKHTFLGYHALSASILEALLNHQYATGCVVIPGKPPVVNTLNRFTFLELLVKNYLALQQTDNLNRIGLDYVLGAEYVSLLRTTELQDALNNNDRNRYRCLTTTVDSATISKIYSMVSSIISAVVGPSTIQTDPSKHGYLSRLAFLSNLLFKARGIDTQSEFLYRACRAKNDAKVLELCDELFNEIYKRLSSFAYTSQGVDLSDSYRKLEEKRKGIEREIRLSVPGSTFPETLANKPIEGLQAQIPRNAALIEIVLYAPTKLQPKAEQWWDAWRYAAVVLTSTGEPQWVDLGEASQINASATRWRKALADKGAASDRNLSEVQQAAQLLDQQVMAKIRPLLGNTNHLLISADGELNLLPFEALQDETGKYLINRYQFSYLTSGRDLLQIADSRKKSQKSHQNAVIFADPDYKTPETQIAGVPTDPAKNDRSGTNVDTLSFNQLTGTREEAKAIKATVLPDAQLLMDGAATETALKRLQSPNLLLIATHGFFLTNPDKFAAAPPVESGAGIGSASELPQQQVLKIENPLLRSGLALAGANQRNNKDRPAGNDDGILTALEVAGLDLRGTQLVVLSACETGVGDTEVGDGVYGLRRALVIAGAESQVLSLWKVSDAATKDLMVNYFTKLVKQGEGRHAALQAAKIELMKNPAYQHPYYWASFIPSGDWTPIKR